MENDKQQAEEKETPNTVVRAFPATVQATPATPEDDKDVENGSR